MEISFGNVYVDKNILMHETQETILLVDGDLESPWSLHGWNQVFQERLVLHLPDFDVFLLEPACLLGFPILRRVCNPLVRDFLASRAGLTRSASLQSRRDRDTGLVIFSQQIDTAVLL